MDILPQGLMRIAVHILTISLKGCRPVVKMARTRPPTPNLTERRTPGKAALAVQIIPAGDVLPVLETL